MTTSSAAFPPLPSSAIVNLASRRRLRQCVGNLIALADSHEYTMSGMLRLLAEANATYGDTLVNEIVHTIERDRFDEASRGISLLRSIATPTARRALWTIAHPPYPSRVALQSEALWALYRLGEPVCIALLIPPRYGEIDCL